MLSEYHPYNITCLVGYIVGYIVSSHYISGGVNRRGGDSVIR